MPKIQWDQDGKRFYETGVKKGVLYKKSGTSYGTGVPWNGLTAVTEKPSGAEATKLWADDINYGTMRSAEEFGLTIEAYTYPDEFAECDGSAEPVAGVKLGQQSRTPFGFSFVTTKGNDSSTNAGYLLHLCYNCTASPSERAYQTINDSPEAITFSWEVETTMTNVTGYKPLASIVIDSTKVDQAKLTNLENTLYGSQASSPSLPSPDEVIAIFNGASGVTGVSGANA